MILWPASPEAQESNSPCQGESISLSTEGDTKGSSAESCGDHSRSSDPEPDDEKGEIEKRFKPLNHYNLINQSSRRMGEDWLNLVKTVLSQWIRLIWWCFNMFKKKTPLLIENSIFTDFYDFH